jgi:hypothetical protein
MDLTEEEKSGLTRLTPIERFAIKKNVLFVE